MMLVSLVEMFRCALHKSLLYTGGLLFGGQLVLADTIDTRGMAPYEQCGYCHEYDGNSRMANFPKLAGQKHAYLVKQLVDFKTGRRDGKGMMQEAAAQLSAQDIEVVAAYFAAQPRKNVDAPLAEDARTLANTIYREGIPARSVTACISCHNTRDKTAPELLGQHAHYLAEQLQAFRRGERVNDGEVMRRIAAELNDNEISALSTFLSSGG